MIGVITSCAACKFLRRRCTSECIFAPYFSYEEAATHFEAVHKVFGASNVSKLLMRLPVPSRSDAAITVSYEALARMQDPVYGCVAHIFALQQQVETYWWNTQKWFPASSVAAGRPNFTLPDLQVLAKQASRLVNRDYATQQGVYESLHRDMRVGFGHWDFDPMDLENPFPNGEASVDLWQGVEGGLVPVTLQRYIVQKLPWIRYHELTNAGHLFAEADNNDAKDAILNSLLRADK